MNSFTTALRRGFTLIELLVVMTIIALLVALSGFAMSGARESARDSRRMSDLETIRSALELYKADCGKYPASLTIGSSIKGDDSNASCLSSNVYLEKVPDDPIPTPRSYTYSSSSPYTTYSICTALEGDTTAATGCTTGSCGSSVTCSYIVKNP